MSYSFRFDSVGISESIGYCYWHIRSSLAVLVYQNLLDIVNVIFVQVWQCWYIRIYWILSMSYSFKFGSVAIKGRAFSPTEVIPKLSSNESIRAMLV